jgi:UDP-glucose 4-epimerase
MSDFATANPDLAMIALRYFNPIGAHQSGLLGEDPNGIPNNLLPFIVQVVAGKRDKLFIFGNDYPTPDGTGVRDYIHVVDLARGHLAALEHGPRHGFRAYNLGTGHGHSVIELVNAYERASGKRVPCEVVARRPGDLAEYYADASLANTELKWHTEYTIDDACRDTWHWQSLNPNGYVTNGKDVTL